MKRKIELPLPSEIRDKVLAGDPLTAIGDTFFYDIPTENDASFQAALQEAYNQGYEDARPKWLPVSEAVMCTEYLVNTRNGLEVAYFDEQGRWHHQSGSGWYLSNSDPTHFQELPDQPTR